MRKPYFFFDTANADDIRRVWEKLHRKIGTECIAGITSNPNALSKVNCHDLKSLEKLALELSDLLISMRRYPIQNGYDEGKPSLHIQIPYSHMPVKEIEQWAMHIANFGNGQVDIHMKIPPYQNVLNWADFHVKKLPELNVTGVADACTAYRCLSHNVRWVSIIPGRMQEKGIDAHVHLKNLYQRFDPIDRYSTMGHPKPRKHVIAGSMRTKEGLQESIKLGCVPTIGIKCWDTLTTEDFEEFSQWWNESDKSENYLQEIPRIDERNVSLTESFFAQMDELSTQMYLNFQEINQ